MPGSAGCLRARQRCLFADALARDAASSGAGEDAAPGRARFVVVVHVQDSGQNSVCQFDGLIIESLKDFRENNLQSFLPSFERLNRRLQQFRRFSIFPAQVRSTR